MKQLQAAANVPIQPEKTEDKELQSLQSAAGIYIINQEYK